MGVAGLIIVGLIAIIIYCVCSSRRSKLQKEEIQEEMRELKNTRPKCTKRVTWGIQVKSALHRVIIWTGKKGEHFLAREKSEKFDERTEKYQAKCTKRVTWGLHVNNAPRWQNGRAFSSRGILITLEKSRILTQNTGKV